MRFDSLSTIGLLINSYLPCTANVSKMLQVATHTAYKSILLSLHLVHHEEESIFESTFFYLQWTSSMFIEHVGCTAK